MPGPQRFQEAFASANLRGVLQKLRHPSINPLMAKVTIQDVARVAGVSVATVDRVLNRRPGVRSVTVNKVESAIRELNYQPDRIAARLARSREYRFCFVLPDRAGEFWERINEEVRTMADRMAGERVAITVKRVDVFDGELLAPRWIRSATCMTASRWWRSIIRRCARRSMRWRRAA